MSDVFADELKTGTKTEHAQLEKKLVMNIKKIHSLAGYASLLKLFYGFYKPLESKLEAYLASYLPDFAERRKADSLLADIKNIGGQEILPSESQDLPEIDSYPAAMGAAYVLEGSTLGGSIIAKMISGQLGITTGNGFSFFKGYEEQTLPKWELFRSALNRLDSDDDRQTALEAARQTFLKFNQWAGNYEPVF